MLYQPFQLPRKILAGALQLPLLMALPLMMTGCETSNPGPNLINTNPDPAGGQTIEIPEQRPHPVEGEVKVLPKATEGNTGVDTSPSTKVRNTPGMTAEEFVKSDFGTPPEKPRPETMTMPDTKTQTGSGGLVPGSGSGMSSPGEGGGLKRNAPHPEAPIPNSSLNDRDLEKSSMPTPPSSSQSSVSNSSAVPANYFSREYPRMKVSNGGASIEDAGFNDFLAQFKSAITQRDFDAMNPLVADDIQVDFDGTRGKLEFVKQWELAFAPRSSKLWNYMDTALNAGVGFDEQSQTYFAPDYQFASDFAAQMLDQEIQPRHQAVITGTRVRARATANTQSDIIEELSWEIVKAKGPDPSTTQAFSGGQAFPWWEISLYNGKTAWVYGKYVQPLGYYRLEFGKVNGEWKLVSFPAPQ